MKLRSQTCNKTDSFAVLHPVKTIDVNASQLKSFVGCLAGIPVLWFYLALAILLLYPAWGYALGTEASATPIQVLSKWIPVLITKGFAQNVLISFFTMLLGTLFGVILGLGQISLSLWVRRLSYFITQIFRNSPWLVLLFIIMLSFPFQIEIGDIVIDIPDWYKAVVGLALPIMANISEIVRGAIKSVPNGQWEAAESLAFSRTQTLWRIILPQIIKRMIPPWMNWYAILAMATPLVSVLGVDEMVTMSRQAMEAENNDPALLVPFYGFCLLVFFIYTYPIARFTIALEKKYAVKL